MPINKSRPEGYFEEIIFVMGKFQNHLLLINLIFKYFDALSQNKCMGSGKYDSKSHTYVLQKSFSHNSQKCNDASQTMTHNELKGRARSTWRMYGDP